mgnify:CR=1 FL=1
MPIYYYAIDSDSVADLYASMKGETAAGEEETAEGNVVSAEDGGTGSYITF